MRGSEVSVPEGPHAVRSTGSLSVGRGLSVADMLQGTHVHMPHHLYSFQDLRRMTILMDQYTLHPSAMS